MRVGDFKGGVKRIKNINVAVTVVLIVIGFTVLFCFGCAKQSDAYAKVATIGGVPVAFGEIEMFLPEAMQSAGEFGDDKEALAEAVVDKALKLVAPYKILQREMLEADEPGDASYKGFVDGWEAENARRRKAIAAGEAVYGPEQYSKRVYYDYLYTGSYNTLKQNYDPSPDDDSLRRVYDENPDMFWAFGQIKMRCLLLDGDEYGRDEADTLLDDLKSRLAAGDGIDTAIESLGVAEDSFERVFTAADMGTPDVTEFPGVSDAIHDLKPGELSGLIDNGGAGYIILCCESRDGEVRKSFEECREDLIQIFNEDAFDKDIAEKTDSATISVDAKLKGLVLDWLNKISRPSN